MGQPISEFFNGGIVNSRHPSLLQSGELQRADDCVYRDNDPAIWSAPGRTALTQAAVGTAIKGIGHLSFDGKITDQFLLYSGNKLYVSPFTAVTGTSRPTMVEVPGQRRFFGTISATTTLTAAVAVASCTISGTAVTTTGTFAKVEVGAVVSGTGITAGTTVLTVNTTTSLTLSQSATSGTVTLTFTTYPFLATSTGIEIFTSTGQSLGYITVVADQDGTTGHYKTATLSIGTTSAGEYTLVSSGGVTFDVDNQGDEILDFAQYGAFRYYLWNGKGGVKALEWVSRTVDSVSVPSNVLSLRPVGLRPVTTAPTIAVQSAQSTGWSVTKGAGTYWILITEIFSPIADIKAAEKNPNLRPRIIESAYLAADPAAKDQALSIGLPIAAVITTVATQNIKITFPTPVNNGTDGYYATHWGVYIYGPSADRPSLASMRRCQTVSIYDTTGNPNTCTLSDTTPTQGGYPSTVADGPPLWVGGGTGFTNSNRMVGAPDDYAASSRNGGSTKSIVENGSVTLSAFKSVVGATDFSSSAPYNGYPVIGIEVRVRAWANASGDTVGHAAYWFYLSDSSGTKKTPLIIQQIGLKHEEHVHGGMTDKMGVAWLYSDIPGIKINIGHYNTDGKTELDFDAVTVTIYYNTATVNFDGPAYRVVTYRDQVGMTVSDPAKLTPPACSTGDFYEGSLVLNDIDKINRIVYSLPGDPEAFPKPYELSFNTKKRDKVTLIKTLGPILIVGMENSIKRVNYLPRETDTDMQSGIAHEDIVGDHGIPGPFCAVKFDMPGVGITLAYVSSAGIFITDGRNSTPLNNDFNWASTVKLSALSTAIMRVYPKEKWIALYYCPAGAVHNRNTRVLYFCYQADKIKPGNLLPAVGPCVVSARSACEAYVDGTHYLLTGHETDGYVYVEDSGTTIPSGYKATQTATASTLGDGKAGSGDVVLTPFIRSRKMYPAGIENDAREDRILLLYSPYGTSVTKTATTTLGSAVIVMLNADAAAVAVGTRVTGTGIDPGVIVLSKSVGVTNTDVTLSRVANASGAVSLVFDTGTIGITIRGSGISEAVMGCDTEYHSTLVGDLLATFNDNMRQGLELQIEKVPLTFDSNHDTLTWADLGVVMRLHQFTILVKSGGTEQSRATS